MRSRTRQLTASVVSGLVLATMPPAARATEPTPPRASDATYDARQNFVACVNGEAGACNPARLTDAERKLVENASSQRNYVACANGWSAGCDPLRLTAEQKRIVDASAAQRAVAPCGSRWALGCGAPTAATPADSPGEATTGSAAGTGTQLSSGPPRYELDTQRFYAPSYPVYEPRYSWSAASWIVPTAIAAAATWPLWTHSYHYDYPWYWNDDWYGYPSWGWGWGWDDGHHHGGHGGHHGHDGEHHGGGGGHHGGKPPTYRPPTVEPLHPPTTYKPTPMPKSPTSSPPRTTQPIKHDWR